MRCRMTGYARTVLATGAWGCGAFGGDKDVKLGETGEISECFYAEYF